MANTYYNHIIETASVFFSQRGIKSNSIDDIAGSCGINKKVFYENFFDKVKLVETVVENILINSEQQIKALPAISPDPLSEMKKFFQYVQGNIYVFTPVFIPNLEKYYPGIYTMLQQAGKKMLIQYLKKNMQRGLQEEIYRKGLDTELAGKLYYWQIKSAKSDGILRDEDRYKFAKQHQYFFL